MVCWTLDTLANTLSSCLQGAGPQNALFTYQHLSPLEHANTYMLVHEYTHHTHKNIHTDTHAETYVQRNRHLCICSYTYVNPQINVHSMSIYIQMCTPIYRDMYTWEHIYAHTWAQTHTTFLHLHICTHLHLQWGERVPLVQWPESPLVEAQPGTVSVITLEVSLWPWAFLSSDVLTRFLSADMWSLLNKRNFICFGEFL